MMLTLRHKRLGIPWLPVFFSDFCAVVVAYYTAFFLRFKSAKGETLLDAIPRLLGLKSGDPGIELKTFYQANAFRLILILTTVLCFLYALRYLYDRRQNLIKRAIAWDVIVANATALALFYGYWYLQRNVYHPRSFFGLVIVLNIILCLSFRAIIEAVLSALRKHLEFDRYPAILAGNGQHVTFIENLISIRHPFGIQTARRVQWQSNDTIESQLDTLRKVIDECQGKLLICDCQGYSVADIMRILEMTQTVGIPVKIISNELAILVTHAHIPCDIIHGVPLVHFDASRKEGTIGKSRHLLTFLTAGIIALALFPLMLLIALAVRLTSKGPAIFVQERIGVNRKPFLLYKFRTMHNQAEELLAEIEEFNESEGAMFKIKKDPRITPLGRFLRRFSLDELPQLINVLKGDMVIVGPRPLPRRDFENYYEEWHYSRHLGLPGLTCLWQISGRSNISFHNMCILDVYYLRNHSWIMDIKISLRTIRVVLFGEGAF